MPPAQNAMLEAHIRADKKYTWCVGGRPPTGKQRHRALNPVKTVRSSESSSIRTVSGGLPTLGKRR